MKLKTHDNTFLAGVALMAVILFAGGFLPARACDSCTNRTEIKIPEQAVDILKALHEHDDMLAATVKKKKLSPVSHIVTTMSAHARALPGKAAADKKVAATNAMASFRTAARELLRAGILEKQSDAVVQAKHLRAALALFDACFDYTPTSPALKHPEHREDL